MPNTTKVYANMLALSAADRLDGEKLRRIVEARTLGDAFKMLGDLGFSYVDLDVDAFVVRETNELIDFVNANAASEELKRALLARFVYNNAKLAYKSRFTAVPSDGYYRTDLDHEKIAKGDYSEADSFMAEALERLDADRESRPQIIDLELTRAMYKYVLSCRLPVIRRYFRAEIDMKNILSAARKRRLNIKDDAFVAGGHISRELLEEAVNAPDFAECFQKTSYFDYADNIEQRGFSELWRAENDSDDYLFALTDEQVTSYVSYKPFINYYTRTLIELKAVKTALVCIKTDSRDVFYARMPSVYGDI